MGEPVYITEEQRDLILNLFGGVRKERVGGVAEAAENALECLMGCVKSAGGCDDEATIAEAIQMLRSALSHASQTTGGE